MKYLIDIGHPAHVHYFRNLSHIFIRQGHEVLFTCRDKDVTVSLLQHYGFRFINLGHPFRSLPGKIFGIPFFTLRIIFISIRFHPDVYLNASLYSAFTAWLFRKPHISLEDTFNMEQVRLYMPFTSCILTGTYDHPSLGKKEIRYNGYQELLYLHPNYFRPDKTVLNELGLAENEPYAVIRFVSWSASHDARHKGMSLRNKLIAVREFSKYARVFVSSESELPHDLKDYEIKIAPHKMHDVLAFSCLVFGESATMVSEAAMLGVPGIFIDDTGRAYTKDLQDTYDLVYNFSESDDDQNSAINKGIELLKNKNSGKEWLTKHRAMLAEKTNVTSFLEWFISTWPESFKIMKNDPGRQQRFK